MLRTLVPLLFCNFLIEIGSAHGGRFDSYGCHHDGKKGEYHCHRGDLAGQVFASRAQAEADPNAAQLATAISGASEGSYDRDLYGGWIDEDGDCQNTRQEVLIAESTRSVTLDKDGCRVLAGQWEDPYTGRVLKDPSQVHIDHFIPLAEVHRSGGKSWTSEQRRRYTNDIADPNTLIAVAASANQSKGDKNPAHWLPPNQAYQCDYLKTWLELKRHWKLSLDPVERQFLADNGCLVDRN